MGCVRMIMAILDGGVIRAAEAPPSPLRLRV